MTWPTKFHGNILKVNSRHAYTANTYLLKVSNRNNRKKYRICSKLTIKTQQRRQWRRSGVIIVNFEHISHLFLVCLLLTLTKCLLGKELNWTRGFHVPEIACLRNPQNSTQLEKRFLKYLKLWIFCFFTVGKSNFTRSLRALKGYLHYKTIFCNKATLDV